MKYSHKLFLVSLLFLLGMFVPFQTGAWLAYIAGVILGVLVTVQTLSTKQFGDIFKAVVFKLNRGNNLDNKTSNKKTTGEKTPNFSIESAKSVGVVGIVGVIIYLIIKLFLKFNILTGSEVDMMGSLCFGAVEGVFLAIAYIAHKLEKEFQKIMSDTQNVSLEQNRIDTKTDAPISSIMLTETELVACITFQTSEISNELPTWIEPEKLLYHPHKDFNSRLSLTKTDYPMKIIEEGLESLKLKGLLQYEQEQVTMGSTLDTLLYAVLNGTQMPDGTYYDKDTHTTVSFNKNTAGDYIFNLVSKEARIVPQSFPKLNLKLVGIASVLIGLVLAGYYFGIINPRDNTQSDLLPTPSEVNLLALGNNKLAYVKNGDIFLADKNGVEQVTSGHNIDNLQVSNDGKYLGWIEKKDFTIEDKTFKGAGYAISYVDLSTLETTYDAIGPLSFVSDEDIYRKEILGFDFVNTDTLSIVYTNDGVWKKEFSTNKSEKLLANNYGKDDSPMDDSRYTSVDISPNLDKLSIELSFWESCSAIFYDFKTKNKTSSDVDNRCNNGMWSSDGKLYWNYSATGMKEGGLWQVDTSTGKMLKKFYDPIPSNEVSVLDFDTNGSDMIAIMEPFFENKNNNLISQEKALYQIDDPNNPKLKLIKTLSGSTDNVKLISNQVSYLESSNLRLINLDGQNEQVIVEGISEYMWIPNGLKNMITFQDRINGFSIDYPSNWQVEGDNFYPYPECNTCGGVRSGIYIDVLDNPSDQGSYEFAKQYINLHLGGQISEKVPDYFSVLNDVTVIKNIPGAGSPGLHAFIPISNGKIIMLASDGLEDETVDRIYSTFRFIRLKTSSKTYINDKYGFSFEYPSEFTQRDLSNNDTDYSFILSTEPVTFSTVEGNTQYYKKNIGWKIKPNNYKNIRDWFVNNFSYDNWQDVEKDPAVSEEIRSNVNVISHRSASAEYFNIDSFVMLNDGQVLELDTWILSTYGKSEPSEEVIGEEINNLIINSFLIK